MQFLKRLLSALFHATLGPILALLLIFEEWGWEPLSRFFAILARLPFWARLEALIRRLPPYGALVVFFVPALMLLPVKLLALYWISRGHALVGLAIVLVAKMLGTAAVARLFALTQPALMQLAWFARLYGRWIPWKNDLIARVKSSVLWRTTFGLVHGISNAIKALFKKLFELLK